MPRHLMAAGAVALLIALSGCGEPDIVVPPSPTPSATPLFASEEEALAAAVAAYGEYVVLADEILREGGSDPDRIERVATGDFLKAALEGFHRVEAAGWSSRGQTEFRNMRVQSFAALNRATLLIVYVCEDVSAVEVVDAAGVSVVSPDRPDTTTFQATFDVGPEGRLLISSREAWSNEPC